MSQYMFIFLKVHITHTTCTSFTLPARTTCEPFPPHFALLGTSVVLSRGPVYFLSHSYHRVRLHDAVKEQFSYPHLSHASGGNEGGGTQPVIRGENESALPQPCKPSLLPAGMALSASCSFT